MVDEQIQEKVQEEFLDAESEEELDASNGKWCTACDKFVYVKGKRKNICTNCGSFVKKYKPGDEPEELKKEMKVTKEKVKKEYIEEAETDKAFQLTRKLNLSGKDLATAEMLINTGVASDFNDLVKKGLDLTYRSVKMPFNQDNPQLNENQEVKPMSTMKDIQEAKMLQAYADSLKQPQNEPPKMSFKDIQEQQMVSAYINSMNKGERQDPMQMMMMMKMMENMEKGKPAETNGWMDKMMQIQMIQTLGKPNQSSDMEKQIADLKYQIQLQQAIKNQDSKAPLQDQLLTMEKIRVSHDAKLKEIESKYNADKTRQLEENMKIQIKVLEDKMNNAKKKGTFGEEIENIKSTMR